MLIDTRQPMHDLPEHKDDGGLRAVPPDVLELSIHHSIKSNTNWPRPSGTNVNRSITHLQLRYCKDYDRVAIINNLSLICLDTIIVKLSRYPYKNHILTLF